MPISSRRLPTLVPGRLRSGLLLALLFLPAPLAAQSIISLGAGFQPVMVSADGDVVAGDLFTESFNPPYPARWTLEGGVQVLRSEPAQVVGMSRDGFVIVGNTSPLSEEGAWQWTEDGGFVTLPAPTLDEEMWAVSVQAVARANGQIIAFGLAHLNHGRKLLRWINGGAPQIIPHGDGDVEVFDMSADGSVVVGWRGERPGWNATKWVNDVPQVLEGGSNEHANVSDDGTVIIAAASGGLNRWDASGRTELVSGSMHAAGISADGSVAVGRMEEQAFIWREGEGVRLLRDVLESDLGMNTSEFLLFSAEDVSADGSVIVGRDFGVTAASWRVELCGSIVEWSASSGGTFGDADNWSSGTIPGTPNVASFEESGSYSVSLNDDVEIDQLQVWEDVDLAMSPGGFAYRVSGACTGRSVLVDGGFLELKDGVLEAARMVELYGAEPVLSVGAAAKLVVDADEDGAGCLVADGGEGTEALVSVAGGGEIESHACTFLGDKQGTRGRMVIDRNGFLQTDTLVIGTLGDGALELPGTDGRVRVNQLWMAVGEGSSARAEVADLSSIVFRDTAYVGIRGEATLEMTNVGIVGGGPALEDLSLLVLGRDAPGKGHLHLKDHSFFQNSDAIVGLDGDGSLILEGSAGAIIRRIWIGGHLEGTTGQGTVGVGGEGSLLEARRIWIGRGRVGILVAVDGGRVTAGQITLYGNGVSLEDEGGQIVAPILQVGSSPTAPKRELDRQNEEGIFVDTLLIMGEGHQLEVEQFVMAPGGVLGGTGTFPFALTNTGVLNPGGADDGASGTFRIADAFDQTASGILDIELSGTEAGQFDRLEIAGAAALGGTLRLHTADGYLPEEGDRFEILTAAAISGTFDAVIQPFDVPVQVVYEEGNVVVEVLNGVTAEEAGGPDRPLRTELGQNYPNPFTLETNLSYSLVEPGMVRITIYDMLGREVIRLVDAHLPAGHHEVVWQPTDLPSGLYICRLQVAGALTERTLTLVN